MDKISEFNSLFASTVYKKYLKRRFGVGSSKREDWIIMSGQKRLYDQQSYTDISSPLLSDQTYFWNCATIQNDSNTRVDFKYDSPLNTVTSPTVTSPSTAIAPIEVIVGTDEAIAAEIIEGTNFIKNSLFAGRYVEVFRNNVNLPSIDPGNGDEFFTKKLTSDTIILRTSLLIGELIKIKVLF